MYSKWATGNIALISIIVREWLDDFTSKDFIFILRDQPFRNKLIQK